MAERPSIDEIVSAMDNVKVAFPAEQRKDELVRIIDEFCDSSYDEGYSDCEDEELDIEESRVEKMAVNYVVDKFKDVETMDQFTEIFNEIRNRSYNFMSPLAYK